MRSAAASSGPGRIANCADREARHVVHAVDLLDAEPLHHAVLDHLAAAAAALLGGLEDHHRGAVRSCASRRDTWRRRAASRCARRGRRRASCPDSSTGTEGWSAHPSAARPCRRAARSPCAAPCPFPWITPTTPVLPIPVTTSSQPNAFSFSATLPAVRCTSNRISGILVDVAPPCGDLRLHLGDTIDNRHSGLRRRSRRCGNSGMKQGDARRSRRYVRIASQSRRSGPAVGRRG